MFLLSISLFICTKVSLEYLRHLVIVNFVLYVCITIFIYIKNNYRLILVKININAFFRQKTYPSLTYNIRQQYYQTGFSFRKVLLCYLIQVYLIYLLSYSVGFIKKIDLLQMLAKEALLKMCKHSPSVFSSKNVRLLRRNYSKEDLQSFT